MRYAIVEIDKSPMDLFAVDVLQYEVPMLKMIHGEDIVRVRMVRDIAVDPKQFTNQDDEYLRLENKYGVDKNGVALVQKIYGMPFEGRFAEALRAAGWKIGGGIETEVSNAPSALVIPEPDELVGANEAPPADEAPQSDEPATAEVKLDDGEADPLPVREDQEWGYDEVKSLLDFLGVEYKGNASKDSLIVAAKEKLAAVAAEKGVAVSADLKLEAMTNALGLKSE